MTYPDRPPRRMAEFDHANLVNTYGVAGAAKRCGECANLYAGYPGSRRVLKCEMARMTSSAASDWRAGWVACGKFTDKTAAL